MGCDLRCGLRRVRATLDELLPEPIERVLEREREQRDPVAAFLATGRDGS
jgi:hypothetical protein